MVARKLNSDDELDCLTQLFVAHGAPENVRSDNGPEFVALNVRAWLGRIGVKTRSSSRAALGRTAIARASTPTARRTPGGGAVLGLVRSKVLIERWRQHYNTIRPQARLLEPGMGHGATQLVPVLRVEEYEAAAAGPDELAADCAVPAPQLVPLVDLRRFLCSQCSCIRAAQKSKARPFVSSSLLRSPSSLT